MSNTSNERWEGDLEADQLDDLAAQEGRDDGSFGAQLPLAEPRHAGASPDDAADAGTNAPAGDRVSNRQWENDLEADQLDDLAAREGRDDELDAGL